MAVIPSLIGLLLVTGCSSQNSGGGSSGNGGSSGDGGSSGSSGSAGDAGSSGSGGSSGSAGSGGSSSSSAGCTGLCSHTNTATQSEVACVQQAAYLKGYNWPNDPVCMSMTSEAMCNTCTDNLAMTEDDCSAIESSCFGGGSGGSGGSGTGGTGGAVQTCQQMCTYAPAATSTQKQCVQIQAVLRGYDWTNVPVCVGANTELGCNACTNQLAMTDADCAAIFASCF